MTGADVTLDLLVPAPVRRLPVRPGEDDLVALHSRPRDVRHVRANMVTSVDGAATGGDGRSGSLGTPADPEDVAAGACLGRQQ